MVTGSWLIRGCSQLAMRSRMAISCRVRFDQDRWLLFGQVPDAWISSGVIVLRTLLLIGTADAAPIEM